MSECPHCHATISAEAQKALVCPHCRKSLATQVPQSPENSTGHARLNANLHTSTRIAAMPPIAGFPDSSDEKLKPANNLKEPVLAQIASILLDDDDQDDEEKNKSAHVSVKDIAKQSEIRRNAAHSGSGLHHQFPELDALDPSLSAAIDISALSRLMENSGTSNQMSSQGGKAKNGLDLPLPAGAAGAPILSRNSDDSLPNVKFDKTLDSPIIDDGRSMVTPILDLMGAEKVQAFNNAVSSSVPRRHEEKTNQVYVSRLGNLTGNTNSSSSLPKPIWNNNLSEQAFPEAQMTETELTSQLSLLDLKIGFIRSQAFNDSQFRVFGIETPFLGRKRELDFMRQAYHLVATQKNMSIVRLVGAGGIGKTRLIFEFLDYLSKHRQYFKLYASLSSINFDESRKIFERLLMGKLCLDQSQTPEAQLRDLVQKSQEYFEGEDAEVALHVFSTLYNIKGVSSTNRELSEIHSNRNLYYYRLREIFGKLLQHDASQCPVIFVMDDIHGDQYDGWAEVNEMLAQFAEQPILVLTTQAAHFENESDEDAQQYLDVQPLSQDEMLSLAKLLLRFVENLPETVAPTIAARAAGNPRALEQILYLLVYKKKLRPIGTQWKIKYDQKFLAQIPSNEIQRMKLRFEGMPEAYRAFLNVASILPRHFLVSDVAKLLSLEPIVDEVPWFNPLRPQRTNDILQALLKLEVLIEIKSIDKSDTYYCFHFMNEREFLASQLPPEYLQTVKGSFARILEKRSPEDTRLAGYFEAAGCKTEAAKYWLKYAKSAFKSFYNTSSLNMLIHCLELVSTEHGEVYIEILNEMGRVASHIGQFDSAEEYYGAMLRTAHFYENKPHSLTAFLGAGNALLVQGKYEMANQYMEYALKLAQELDDDGLIADCNEGIARAIFCRGQKGALVNALRYAEKSLETRRKIADIAKTAQTLDIVAKICFARGDLDRAMTSLTEAVNAKNAMGLASDTPETLITTSMVMDAFLMPDPVGCLYKADSIALQTGRVADLFWSYSAHAMSMIKAKRFEDAYLYINAMADILKTVQPDPWFAEYYRVKSYYEVHRGNLKKATKNVRRFIDFATPLRNQMLIAEGHYLSAVLNYEVYIHQLGEVSLQKTEKLFRTAIAINEAIGAWHVVARCQRKFADFLKVLNRTDEANQTYVRADKVDPYLH